MTAFCRADDAQRPVPPRAADHENIATGYELSAQQAIALVLDRAPDAELVETLQDPELVLIGQSTGG